jgi:hypothetical protein
MTKDPISGMTVDEATAPHVNADTGLTRDEVDARRKQSGYNEVAVKSGMQWRNEIVGARVQKITQGDFFSLERSWHSVNACCAQISLRPTRFDTATPKGPGNSQGG